MSSILKALKKLDAERNPASGQALANAPEPTSQTTRTWLPLVAGAVLGGLAVAALLVWSKSPVQPVEKRHFEIQELSNAPPLAPVAPAAPDVAPVPVVMMPKEAPVAAVQAVRIVPEPKQAPPAPSVLPKAQRAPVVEPVHALPVTTAVESSSTGLIVTEIIFSETGDSMAVVNDLPVMEGTQIEGAVVEQIHEDHVMFRRGRDLFKVVSD